MLQEQIKGAEKDIARYKQELQQEKETCFQRIQEGESERIKSKTENIILQERLQNTKAELDELKNKYSVEYA